MTFASILVGESAVYEFLDDERQRCLLRGALALVGEGRPGGVSAPPGLESAFRALSGSSRADCTGFEALSSEQISEIARAVHPRDTLKWLARRLDVPIGTARHWLYVKFSSDRRRELARALLDEMDQQDLERSAIRRTLARWAAE